MIGFCSAPRCPYFNLSPLQQECLRLADRERRENELWYSNTGELRAAAEKAG